MVDELIYSELAKSFAASAASSPRHSGAGYSVVYPILICPAYALFDSLPDAYAAVKTINASFMSLAAVPAYLLARRLRRAGCALAAAVLAVAVPSLVYTGTVMTENAFYPLFLLAALALVLVLERPTLGRQLPLLARSALAFATRVAGGRASCPRSSAAPLLLASSRTAAARDAVAFRLLYALFVGGAVARASRRRLVRGRSLPDLLGAYAVVGDVRYDVGTRRALLPLPPGRARPLSRRPARSRRSCCSRVTARRSTPALRAVPRRGIALTRLAAARRRRVRVGVREPDPGAEHVRRRAVLPDRAARLGRPRRCRARAGVAARRGRRVRAAPAGDPVRALHRHGARSRTRSRCCRSGVPTARCCSTRSTATVLAGGVAGRCALRARAASLGTRAPRSDAALLPRDLAQRLVRRARLPAGVGRGALPGHPRRRPGLDRPRPCRRARRVAVVWTGVTDRFAVNQNEFFNRSVGPIYYIGGADPGRARGDGGDDRRATARSAPPTGERIEPAYLLAEDVDRAGRRAASPATPASG